MLQDKNNVLLLASLLGSIAAILLYHISINGNLVFLALIVYSIIIVNLQILYTPSSYTISFKSVPPYWLVPMMLSLQYFISKIKGYEMATFMLTLFMYPLVSSATSLGENLKYIVVYALFPIPAAAAMAYMHLSNPFFIVVGPLWDYALFKRLVVYDNSFMNRLLSSLFSSLVYYYMGIGILFYVLLSVLLKSYIVGKKIGYILLADGILRIVMAWAVIGR